jgi:hypothetical protein
MPGCNERTHVTLFFRGGGGRLTCIFLAGKTENEHISLQLIKQTYDLKDEDAKKVIDFEPRLMQASSLASALRPFSCLAA